jgi:hypothetical protein
MNADELSRLVNHVEHFYDPAKAHEYYLRTRVLKGRPGSASPEKGTPANGHRGASAAGVRKPMSPPPNSSHAQLQKHAQDRTAALKSRIKHLKAVLESLVAEAKRRNAEAKSRSAAPTQEKKSTVKPSPSQKPAHEKHHQTTAKERLASKKYYQQHKKPATDKELQRQIEQLNEKIRTIRRQLKTAVRDARPNPGANRASGEHSTNQRSK